MITEPYDWWHSGRFWYCSLHKPGVGTVSGCGVTKDEAVADGRKDLVRLERRPRKHTKIARAPGL